MKDFIEHHPSFICRFARASLKNGKLFFRDLPEGKNLQESLFDAVTHMMKHDQDGMMLVDTHDPRDHDEGMRRVWEDIHTELVVACKRFDCMGIEAPIWRSLAQQEAQHHMKNPQGHDSYFQSASPKVRSDRLIISAINSLYPTTPQVHPRWAPLSGYGVVRFSAFKKAVVDHQGILTSIQTDLSNRTTIPYEGMIPYIRPNDARYAPTGFSQFMEYAERMKALIPEMTADSVHVAGALHRGLLQEHKRQRVPGQATQDIAIPTEEHMRRILEEAGLAKEA